MRFGSPLNGYDAVFALKMGQLRKQGFDFEGGARAALEAKFGGAAEVLLRDMTEQERREPQLFASGLARAFGRGALGFLDPIVKYGDRGLFPRIGASDNLATSLSKQLPEGGEPASKSLPLHDQRIKDEDEKYSDEYD